MWNVYVCVCVWREMGNCRSTAKHTHTHAGLPLHSASTFNVRCQPALADLATDALWALSRTKLAARKISEIIILSHNSEPSSETKVIVIQLCVCGMPINHNFSLYFNSTYVPRARTPPNRGTQGTHTQHTR